MFLTFVWMDPNRLDEWLKKRRDRRANVSAEQLFNDLQQGDLNALSRSITLLESTLSSDKEIAEELINLCAPFIGNSIRIGITGVPGVGKSTFIEAFGDVLLNDNRRIAVLAIDPSSETTGGSILGDKTRMQDLSTRENVFIRPSASGNSLGGVARKTRESIFLCEACGFDLVLVETVGVGQSETMVHHMVDFFLLLMLSGAGDELQGIKRGIMEMADLLVITKADGENEKRAKLAARQYANAMHLFPPKPSGWVAKTDVCSALEKKNLEEIWAAVKSFELLTKNNGWWEEQRKRQDMFWLEETLKDKILADFFTDEKMLALLKDYKGKVHDGQTGAFQAADQLYHYFISKKRND